MRLKISAVVLGGFGLLGCGDSFGPDGPTDESSALKTDSTKGPPEAPGPDVTPPILASVVANNGNTVTFYDTGDGVLIAERGRTPTPSLFRNIPPETQMDPVATWKIIAPEVPVPDMLVAAQERRMQSPAKLTDEDAVPVDELGVTEPAAEALVGGGAQVDDLGGVPVHGGPSV